MGVVLQPEQPVQVVNDFGSVKIQLASNNVIHKKSPSLLLLNQRLSFSR